MSAKAVALTAVAVLRHPSLWPTAVAQLRRMTPPRWWRKAPFLPVPDANYVRFRLYTMYGDGDHPLEPDDLLAYLRWCRAYPAHSSKQAGKRTQHPGQAPNTGPGRSAGK